MISRMLLSTLTLIICLSGCGSPAQVNDAALKTDTSAVEMSTLDEKGIDFTNSWISSWCETIIKKDCSFAAMASDYTVYQVIVKTDYTAYDYKDLSKDIAYAVSLLNRSSLKDDVPVTTIYIKCLGSDGTPIVEYVAERNKLNNDSFEVNTFMINIAYEDIVLSSLGGD